MKKYISFLSFAAAFFMQSCERSDSEVHITEQGNQSMKAISHKESLKTENNSSTAKEDSDSLEDDSKDEPKRDKQHWKIAKDSIL
ncbi:hypothetical protein CMT58_13150 [Elizabethkingia anophelis]|jgi:hypothetical protein|uniref:hypothetical protein n=1 Tax=Elizabethkingia anophelis TaxID=1117645 RepID=UPI00248DC626|nr:hypothetical protein [Elizabethkingia anophelis]EJC8060750.1 hypothetical protein [Elizabethkingia anophelis]MDV4007230.1 hypothetical protein [Elizabethkingia anophelis]WBS70688.1 hypothetical protein PF435_15980 [Elizabethkingia anophelis]